MNRKKHMSYLRSEECHTKVTREDKIMAKNKQTEKTKIVAIQI